MKSAILITVSGAFVLYLLGLAVTPGFFAAPLGGIATLTPAMVFAAAFIILPVAIALIRLYAPESDAPDQAAPTTGAPVAHADKGDDPSC